MQRAIPRRERVEVGPVPRPVVMIREQGRMGGVLGKRSNAGAQHVPGPRLQYSAGEPHEHYYCFNLLQRSLVALCLCLKDSEFTTP